MGLSRYRMLNFLLNNFKLEMSVKGMGWNEYFGGKKTLFLMLESIVLSKLRKELNNSIYTALLTPAARPACAVSIMYS